MLEGEIYHNTKCEPEIVISYDCNIDICPYCYARDQRINDKMSVDSFGDLLGWFKEVVPDLKGITILGGEPTTIKNLEEYLQVAEKTQMYVNFFTNGSFDEERSEMLASNPAVKTFFFHFEPAHFTFLAKHEHNFRRNIAKLKSKNKDVRLRINFHGIDFDYKTPVNLASEYNTPIAWSITSPCRAMKDYVRQKDMLSAGKRLGEFLEMSKKANLEVHLLRPIPRCAFPDYVFEAYKDYSTLGRNCNISTYVHPDLTVQMCTVMDDTKRGPIKSAKELRKAILEFQKIEQIVRNNPSFNVCPDCDEYANSCQGGCFSYKIFGDHT